LPSLESISSKYFLANLGNLPVERHRL
jgi:hypothetical protein